VALDRFETIMSAFFATHATRDVAGTPVEPRVHVADAVRVKQSDGALEPRPGPPTRQRSLPTLLHRIVRWSAWIAGAILALLVLVAILSYALERPLTHTIERSMNRRLKGYTASVGRAHFNPFNLSMNLYDVSLIQDAHPDPAIARFPHIWADLEFVALVHRRLAAKFAFDAPVLYLDRTHVEEEAKDPTPLQEHGWQEALEAAYPFKMDLFRVRNGRATYVERSGTRPLELTGLVIEAHNIRNVRSPDRTYPSSVHVEATVFGRGRVVADGHADFLAEPHVAFKGDASLDDIALDFFAPVLDRYHTHVRQGTLSAAGSVEYGRATTTAELKRLEVRDLDADYEYRKVASHPEKAAARQAKESARSVSNAPETLLRADTIHVTGRIGMSNPSARPAYRVFLSDVDLVVQNFSNHFSQGPATAELRAKFMGSGPTRATATFRPETRGPNFDMRLAIEDTDMRAMNDLLRAYAKIDVASGLFSFFGDLGVKDQQVTGWVKPLFHELKVYSPEQDRDKTFLEKLREHVVDLASKLFKNRRSENVATETTVQGPVGRANANTLDALVHLVQNAFFKAILPGFEHSVGQRSGRAGSSRGP
jgi:uncharacterized protein DUF748